jgi:hypothetical protein
LVATNLPGVVEELAPRLGDALELVELPAMAGVDTPIEAELGAFVERLAAGIETALDAPPLGDQSETLESFTWVAVFRRVEAVWRRLIGCRPTVTDADAGTAADSIPDSADR